MYKTEAKDGSLEKELDALLDSNRTHSLIPPTPHLSGGVRMMASLRQLRTPAQKWDHLQETGVKKSEQKDIASKAEMLDSPSVDDAPSLQRTVAPREAKSTHSEKPLHTSAPNTADEPEPLRALQKTRSSLQSSPRGPRGYLWPIRRALGRSDRTPFMTGRIHDKSN